MTPGRQCSPLAVLVILFGLIAGAAGARAEATSRDGTFAGKGGVSIAYRVALAPEPIGAVVLLNGYTESYLFYDELIADFRARHVSVYAIDHRGMGMSARLAENPQVVHVERFDDYVDDAEAFVATVVRPEWTGPLFLFGHSTGGLVGLELLARQPEWFKAAALGSPLLGLNTGAIPGIVAQSLVTMAAGLGLGAHYAPGYGDVQLESKRFETNKVTHSAERYAAHHQILAAHPELLMGGPSSQWVRAVYAATADVDGLARRVSTPLVLFQAGADAYVLLEPQDRFCRQTASCKLVRFPGAYHELIREQDDVRSALLDETLRHFEAHARQP